MHEELKYNTDCPYRADIIVGGACSQCSHFADFVMPGRVVSMFKITTGQLDRCVVEIQITVLVEFPVSGARTFIYKRAQTESLSALLDFFNQFEINRTYECHLTVDDTTQLKLSDIKKESNQQ